MNPAAPTLAGRWSTAVHRRSDAPFLVWEGTDGQVTTWSYAEFDRVVDDVAGGLVARQVGAGDAVHLVLTNSPAFVALWLATARLGAWIVPSDPTATARELAEHQRRTQAVLTVAVDGAEAPVAACAETDVALVTVDVDDTRLDRLRAEAPPKRKVGPAARAAVMFTSGTTSAPKGVEVTQANYAFAGDVMAAASATTADDRHLVVLPLFHANAQYYSFAAAISAGASVTLMPRFSASGFLSAAARHGATHASLFAAPIRMILAAAPVPEPGLVLRHCWYAQNLTDAQYEEIAALLGCRPRQLYGMTETIPAVLTSRAIDTRPDTMGETTLGCELALLDADGAPVPEGEVGEICVRGARGRSLFAGYLDDPATTEASFRNGWFRTGDRARIDDGQWRFDGRRSDVLKVSGENVSIVEVEEVVARHPAVLDVAVVGRPDPVRDEVPVAYVVARPGGQELDVEELAAHCETELAKSKRPAEFHVVDELPRTSVGKIRKFLLRDPAPSGGVPS
ncbi:MAG: AMP-binding protein [Actinomycetota bacterium]